MVDIDSSSSPLLSCEFIFILDLNELQHFQRQMMVPSCVLLYGAYLSLDIFGSLAFSGFPVDSLATTSGFAKNIK